MFQERCRRQRQSSEQRFRQLGQSCRDTPQEAEPAVTAGVKPKVLSEAWVVGLYQEAEMEAVVAGVGAMD